MDYSTLSRLKLQSLCVKHGLDATGKNEELIQRLQAHSSQSSNNVAQVSENTMKTTTATTTVTASSKASRTEVTVETVAQLEVSVKREEQEERDIHEESRKQHRRAATPIKQEEETTLTVPGNAAISPEVKQEPQDLRTTFSLMHHQEMDNPFLVKSEEPEAELKRESLVPEIKEEADQYETTRSRKALREFWESRSKAEELSAAHNMRQDTKPPSKIIGKRARSSTVGDVDEDRGERNYSVDSEHTNNTTSRSRSPADSLPRSGTVRKLIGKFGSGSSTTPEPLVGSPSAAKRQRLDPNEVPLTSPSVARVARFGLTASSASQALATTATVTTLGPASATSSPKPKVSRRAAAAEAARRVIKIPTVKKESAPPETLMSTPSVTPPPPTTPKKGVSTPKRKAPSSEDHAGLETPSKRTYTGTGKAPSAETINRLATPKNKALPAKKAATSASSATTSSSSSSASVPAPPTPTRPRAPVLSTASRAAQRAKRHNS